jgi:hypothetical protein
MSSVTRFLRQRQTGQTMLQGPAATGADVYFNFVAGPGNFVGNYPPGEMVDATLNVAGLIANVGVATTPVMRDMGKTIKASVVSGPDVGTPGFFREVQLLIPSTVAFPTSASNNGVIGQLPGQLPAVGNTGDAGYATFYIPIVVDGVVASNALGTAPLVISAAGLMVGEQL